MVWYYEKTTCHSFLLHTMDFQIARYYITGNTRSTHLHTRTRITGLKLYNTNTPQAIVTYVHTYVPMSLFELDFKFLAFANASAC